MNDKHNGVCCMPCIPMCLCHKDDDREPNGHCDCCESYLNLFGVPPQNLDEFGGADDTVKFAGNNAITAADWDISQMGISGAIKFLKAGVYRISWGVHARIQQPVPTPVPSFSFALWRNGVLVPGSTHSGYTQAPGDDAVHLTGNLILEMAALDEIKIRNVSAHAVSLDPNTVGIQFPVTVSTVNINCLKEL